MGSLYVCFPKLGRRASQTKLDADGEILADTSVDDYINDASSMEIPSSLFESRTPTFESEDDSDFTSALLLMMGFAYFIQI